MKDQPFSIAKRIRSFGFAFSGLKTLFKEEHNALIHLAAALGVIVLGWVYALSRMEWVAITFCIGFVFVMEILNTSIENIADFVSPERNDSIKKVKDLAAAAVLIAALTTLIIGALIFIPKILNL